MYNYHVHSKFSFDSGEDVEQICEEAIKAGLSGICFTDHCDFAVPSGKDHLFDYDAYREEIGAMQQKYAGKLTIGLGIEMGLQKQELATSRDYLQKHPFDFIMASCHYIDGEGVFKGTFCQGKTMAEAFGQYFGRIYEMIQIFDMFHVLGHLDVIRRDEVFLDRPFRYARVCAGT